MYIIPKKKGRIEGDIHIETGKYIEDSQTDRESERTKVIERLKKYLDIKRKYGRRDLGMGMDRDKDRLIKRMRGKRPRVLQPIEIIKQQYLKFKENMREHVTQGDK